MPRKSRRSTKATKKDANESIEESTSQEDVPDTSEVKETPPAQDAFGEGLFDVFGDSKDDQNQNGNNKEPAKVLDVSK